MAQVVIIVTDTSQGPSLSYFAEPGLPQTVLDGAPTPAQNVAMHMLASVREPQAEPNRIITLN